MSKVTLSDTGDFHESLEGKVIITSKNRSGLKVITGIHDKTTNIMDEIIVPYTNGTDQEIKGYVDLTSIIKDAVKEIEDETDNNS